MATIFDLQARNRRKTRIIVACFLMFFIWLGLGLDLSIYYFKGSRVKSQPHSQQISSSSPGQAITSKGKPRRPFYPVFAVILGVVGMGIAWWNMSRASEIVIKSLMAKEANKDRDESERVLINVVEEMCIASGMRVPKIWIIPDMDPNALATGMQEGDYHIAVTKGLLNVLTRDELQAVVAHEVAHLKNGDTRLMTCLAVLVGITALISELVTRSRWRNSGSSMSSGSGTGSIDGDDVKIGIVIYVLWFVSILIAPIVTHLMSLMVSREREYLADASSAQFTRNPGALASALAKIARAVEPTNMVRPASAMLCIASPTAADLSLEEKLFATHPPIKERIARLRSMGAAYGSDFPNTIRLR